VTRVVDYLCNAFTPERAAVWKQATAGLALKIRDGEFVEPEAMVDRMDELGIDTVLLPAVALAPGELPAPTTFEAVAVTWDEIEQLANTYPDRFAALAVLDPTSGMAGVREVRGRLQDAWVAGCYLHTHSWDRPLDHADYYPYYALASELDVPIAMQAGASGGMTPSESGRPIGIDRPALYFPDTRFVLSHTGWPWVDEAIAMARKFPNVFVGTGSYPPRHWPAALVDFACGAGRDKVLFGTNFPTVGHRQALEQLPDLGLEPSITEAVLGGNARRVFTRLERP
jgi:predicted TIM-barrel fold metal-dependent hydrolase